MTTHQTPEEHKGLSGWTSEEHQAFRRRLEGIDARYPAVALVIPSPDRGLDTFHLDGVYSYSSFLYAAIAALALPMDPRQKEAADAFFMTQFIADSYRRSHLRPLARRLRAMLWQVKPGANERQSLPWIAVREARGLQDGIRHNLAAVGVRQTAAEKSEALVALAESCLYSQHDVDALIIGTADPLPELWHILLAVESIGWWVDEVYPWLRPLAIRLVESVEEDGDEKLDDLGTLRLKKGGASDKWIKRRIMGKAKEREVAMGKSKEWEVYQRKLREQPHDDLGNGPKEGTS